MAATEEEIRSPANNNIEIVKWKVKKGSQVFKHSVLALYKDVGINDPSQNLKLKSHVSGIVMQINVAEGTTVHPGDVLLVIQTISTCAHTTIMKDMCGDCGADLRKELGAAGDRKAPVAATVAMVHSIPELVVSQELAMELGKEDENRLLRERKLVLLVDLDQTLIHTTNDNIPPNLKDVKHFQLWHGKGYMWYHTRFRPFTHKFLEAVSKMYELHICTFGVRMYAHMIARLLDPDEKYFSHRILSRDECFDALSKTANLKALFPCGDKMVAIIDDREDVWNHAPNLVHVKPYRFFQGTADINAPPGLTKSEHDNEPLAHKILDQLAQKEQTQEDSEDSNMDIKKMKEDTSDSKLGNMKTEETKDSPVHTIKDRLALDLEANKSSESTLCSKETSSLSQATSEEIDGKKDDSVSETKTQAEDSKCSGEKTSDNVEMSTENNSVSGAVEPADESDQENRRNSESEMKTDNDDDEYDGKDDEKKAKKESTVKKKWEEEIEWEDEDDYLLHLEEILTRIHQAYYGMYEQSQLKGSRELPDMKNVIPYVKRKVLKGANIVFSGMFPLNMPAEKSRAYIVAKALGATIQSHIVPSKSKSGSNSDATTHLVAAKSGTGKHKVAIKTKGVYIVHGDWLWACSERWERVDEVLYPLASREPGVKASSSHDDSSALSKFKSMTKKRKSGEIDDDDDDNDKVEVEEDDPVGSEHDRRASKKQKFNNRDSQLRGRAEPQPSTSQEAAAQVPGETFANSINPLYSFSDEDIEFMDKEVNEIMDEEGDGSDESDEEREARIRQEVLRQKEESDSDSDSLSGDFPRGWKMRRKSFSPKNRGSDEGEDNKSDVENNDEETENELERYQKNMAAFAPDDTESESTQDEDSIGSVDDEIADAVEKEFLGFV